MFNAIKKLLGIAPVESKQEEAVILPKETAKKPKAPKTTKTKEKVENIDLDSLSKTELLAEAKKRGIKANASLKKDEILERIKSA